MTDYAETSITRTQINAPIGKVWSALTATDRPLPFFFNAVCQTKAGLQPGARMRMVSPNGKNAMVVGDVTAFDPPFKYAHTFQMTHIDEAPCLVTYDLVEKDGGTEFTLTIERAIAGGKLHKEMLSAQGFIATNLKSLVETGKPAFSGRMVGVLGPIFGLFTKSVQAEDKWPL